MLPHIRFLRRDLFIHPRSTLRRLSDRVPRHIQLPGRDAISDGPVQAEFRQGFEQVTSFYGRFIKYTTLSFFSLASMVYIGWEGCHQWVERVELAPPPSPFDDLYQWSEELDVWTSASGGTDPKLGYRGRHAVRAAWMALNWSGEPNLNVIESTVAAGETSGNAFDTQLYSALSHLSTALAVSYRNAGDSETETADRDPTVMNLLALSGAILDRITSPSALAAAKPMLKEVHDFHLSEGRVNAAARLSVKLGDVCARLGENGEAIEWWDSALRALGVDNIRLHLASVGSLSLPSNTSAPSPAQHRIIASALASLSGHYASTRQFSKAHEVEMAGLALITHHLLPSSSPSDKTWSPDAILHQLFLCNRASILLMHLAEVTFAQERLYYSSSSVPSSAPSRWNILWPSKQPRQSSIQENADTLVEMCALRSSALSAEQICDTLTNPPDPAAAPQTLHTIGTTLTQGMHRSPIPASAASGTSSASTSSTALHPSFAKSRTLSKPSTTLLRQSKRIAAQSLQLRGILFEKRGEDAEAMEEYERALAWVGGGPDGRTGPDAIESEWRTIWERYVKVRERVLKKDGHLERLR
jgi:hypothetical protein